MQIDFRSKLAKFRCYDEQVEKIFRETDVPSVDCILQNREELIQFCCWIKENNIKSYLEIGVWTGQLISTLHHLFRFTKLAACDVLEAQNKWGLNINVPEETNFFTGDCNSDSYVEWRKSLGHIDLVFIDGDHKASDLRKCFNINSQMPNRYLAFHDIYGDNKWTEGVREFWQELNVGRKIEIVAGYANSEFSLSKMGIGIWCHE